MVTQGVSITTRLASSFHTVDASRSRQHVRAQAVFQTLGHDAQVRLTLAGRDHFPGEPFATAGHPVQNGGPPAPPRSPPPSRPPRQSSARRIINSGKSVTLGSLPSALGT